jgi:hypothetical protein
MHRNALCDPQIPLDAKKYKFDTTCPSTLFMEITSGPPEHEKGCADVSHPGYTGMHYVTRRSHRMQKHKFGVTCPDALFIISVPVPPKHEK